MWPLTSHVPLRVSLVTPSREWGQSLINCLGLSVYSTYMPFNLGLVSHGAYALGLPKGKIQYMADLAQNGAETSLDGLWDLGKVRKSVRKHDTTLTAREESGLPYLHMR